MIIVKGVYFLSVLLLLQIDRSNGKSDFFTSTAGMEELLTTEVFLLSHLNAYVQSMTSQLEMLKSAITDIKKEHTAAKNGIEEYLTSPVNAFLLIKRLDKDWKLYEDAVENEAARKSFLAALKFSRSNLSFPTEEDTTGSVLALVRLQNTYQLETAQIASGIINGVKYGSSMSWQDCFQLGEQLFTLKDFNHTIPWLKESYQKLQAEEFYNTTESIAFLEVIASYFVHMGDFKTAMELNNRLLELEPDRSNAREMKKYLDMMVKRDHGCEYGVRTPPETNEKRPYENSEEFKTYQKVCRGEIKQSPSEERLLRCRNDHRNVPYRFLMPFKVEEMNLDPYVIVFYDVIYDSEIEPIKDASKGSLSRSEVQKSAEDSESDLTISQYRTSQNTWLSYNTMPETRRLRHRLEDITGLDMSGSEKLQVANYGIGGHYDPHLDFFLLDSNFDKDHGNRIATAIFYLSDVELGGATAFTFLKRAMQPKKGSLMFWYNLHKDDEKDYRTKHAACPVLKGSKWVANVWIRSRFQMFRRPCGLQPDHEISLPYKEIK